MCLAALDSPKITINARTSKRDLHTNTVLVNMEESNIYKTGGLPGSIVIAKGARWMLTRNIDVADHLVNGATGIIENIDIDPSKPLQGCIYVKFDMEDAGREARRNNPPHLKLCTPIKAMTVKFFMYKQCHVPVERLMYPGVLAYGITCHKAQGSTYNFLVADLTKPSTMKSVQPGQAYTMISRATSRAGIKLVNFSSDKLSINRAALQEITRMESEAPFLWNHPLDDLPNDCLHIGHLNIRSLNLHAADLLSDTSLHQLSVLCISETHVRTDLIYQCQIPGFTLYHVATEHGIAVYTKFNLKVAKIDVSTDAIQIIGVTINNSVHVLSVYKPPSVSPSLFLASLSDHINRLGLSVNSPIVLLGDFNMEPNNTHLLRFMQRNLMTQLISEPTHVHGGTLDLIMTTIPSDEVHNSGSFPVPYTDHHLVWASFSH